MSDAIAVLLHRIIEALDSLVEASELRGGLAADDGVREQAIAKYNELCAAAQIPDALFDAAILHAARLGGDATACVRAACAALDALAERVRRDWPGDVGAFGSDEWCELNEAIAKLRPYTADGGGQAANEKTLNVAVGPAEHAMAILLNRPDIPPEELAEKVGVARSTLYSHAAKWRWVRQTLMARDADAAPRGRKDADGIDAETDDPQGRFGDDE